ncbi:MAG: hypothetical protein BM485_10790 [Desulfobulbaceae bacterium DB1]|nr:MAG: hypothetical protein BM485_10790 [Desulfobulbaceae bacterium DB1]
MGGATANSTDRNSTKKPCVIGLKGFVVNFLLIRAVQPPLPPVKNKRKKYITNTLLFAIFNHYFFRKIFCLTCSKRSFNIKNHSQNRQKLKKQHNTFFLS